MGPCISHLCCNTPKCAKLCWCCMCASDRYSDDVRVEVGDSSESLYRLGDRLKEYSAASKRMSEATRGVCAELDHLASLESSEARVMLIQFSDHLKAQEFGQCATKQSYTNQEKDQYSKFNRTAQMSLTVPQTITEKSKLGHLIYGLQAYDKKYRVEIKKELKMHDKLWLAHNKAMSAQHKGFNPASTEGASSEQPVQESAMHQLGNEIAERTLRHTNDAFTRSQMGLRERIAQHKVRRQQDLRDLVELMVGGEVGLHACSLERLTAVAEHISHVPSISRADEQMSGAAPSNLVETTKELAASDIQITRFADGRLQPLEVSFSTLKQRHCQPEPLPPHVFQMLHSLEARFGPSMSLQDIDCLLREMLYDAPAEEGASAVSHRFFTIFSPPKHAMAAQVKQRGVKPGCVRTLELTAGLAALITVGGLEHRVHNSWDVLDGMKRDHVDRRWVVCVCSTAPAEGIVLRLISCG
eukprot:TRINITY_DN4851_c0_g1_i2.p1 TRINITY_DN4851_c0_g1~~TRINITY_DN4851_c0_g1_i2.p1  ORF type:complete len:470 (+),score=120.38 TRINITY_DN4851_c0_g1_i2:69-1478(+)